MDKLTTEDRAALIRYALGGNTSDLANVGEPYTCEFCPFGAKTREPYEEIWNDVSEAHYICPVLNEDVWGERPKCGEQLTAMLREELAKLQAIDPEIAEVERRLAEEKSRMEAEHRRVCDLRASALAKLTDEEAEALGLRRHKTGTPPA